MLGGLYVGEPRRSRLDSGEEIHMAAAGTRGGWSPAVIVPKAPLAAVW